MGETLSIWDCRRGAGSADSKKTEFVIVPRKEAVKKNTRGKRECPYPNFVASRDMV